MSNVYYNPENWGLTPVGELEYSDHYYNFDTRAVWWHSESGKVYTARDSGCSCPTPFEDYTSLADLQEIGPGYLKLEWEAESEYSRAYVRLEDVDALEEKVKKLLEPPLTDFFKNRAVPGISGDIV